MKNKNIYVIATTAVFIMLFSCSVNAQSSNVKSPNIPNIVYNYTDSIVVDNKGLPLSKQDYAWIYRIFGNVKITMITKNNKTTYVQNPNIPNVTPKTTDKNKTELIIDEKEPALTKQDSAWIYRIFGDFKIISR